MMDSAYSVVKPEVAEAFIIPGDSEVQADGLCVSDVEVAVRFGREAGVDGLVPARCQVVVDYLSDEVMGGCFFG
jgi:hypothetical protein